MTDIFIEIEDERERQNQKWGVQFHELPTWIAILTEEVGEAAKEAIDYHCKNPVKNDVGLYVPPDTKIQDARLLAYRKELVQIAAVAVQMIEHFDTEMDKWK